MKDTDTGENCEKTLSLSDYRFSDEQDADGFDHTPENALILEAGSEELENAPAIDPANLPEIGDQNAGWVTEINCYWSSVTGGIQETPVVTGTLEAQNNQETEGDLQGLVLATELIEGEVSLDESNVALQIEDIVVDPKNGELLYAAVQADGIDDMTDETAFVTVDLIESDPESDTLMLPLSADEISAVPAYQTDRLPNTRAPDWDADIRAYWDEWQSSS